MTDHIHRWNPVDGRMGRYECDCGALGRRCRNGKIEEDSKPRRTERWTARGTGRITGGRIPPKPGA